MKRPLPTLLTWPRVPRYRLHELARWGLYALALMTPGSLAVFAVLWLVRRYKAASPRA